VSPPAPLVTFPVLAAVPGVRHGVSGRAGGVSEGDWASLNVSYTVGDETERVEENLCRLTAAVGHTSDDLFPAYQVHGTTTIVVESDAEPRPHADALVTRQPGRVLMLRYADCVPVLLADSRGKAVGVAHAGWRGTAAGVVKSAVAAMSAAFGCPPGDLVAAIGPSIGPCCYEVGDDVVGAFTDRAWALRAREGHRPHLDLWELNRRALLDAGVPAHQINLAAVCTQCHQDEFFSYRAARGGPSGRFAEIVALE
jgi:YfiH family protein